MKPAESYMFLVSRPAGAPTDPESLIGALEGLGVQVDRSYGAVPIDPLKLRFVLRGTANADAIEAAAHDPTVEVFADPHVITSEGGTKNGTNPKNRSSPAA
jgi:hypothetical protein